MKNRRSNQLVVGNVEEEIVRALHRSAAQHSRSPEAEHREILRRVLILPRAQPTAKRGRSLKELLLAMPNVGEDSDFERIGAIGSNHEDVRGQDEPDSGQLR